MTRHEPRYKRTFTDQSIEPCRVLKFDQSNMDDLEFERLLLWSYRFPKYFDASDDAELTAEVYRRAAQLRKEPKHKQTPFEVPVVRMADLGVVE